MYLKHRLPGFEAVGKVAKEQHFEEDLQKGPQKGPDCG